MSCDLLSVADAVVSTLNAAVLAETLSPAFTAERLYQPAFELPDMATLHVSVVPRTKTTKPLTRSRNIDVYTIDVGIQKKFNAVTGPEINTALDPLVTLVDAIVTLFDKTRPATFPSAICTARKPDPIYAPEHMEHLRQFTSIVALEFTVIG